MTDSDPPARVPVLETHGVSKYFGGVEALHDVSMRAFAGRVLALLGDNGAGKSTLIKILSGVIKPSGGEIFMQGHRVSFDNPSQARELGISTVFQDLAVCNLLSVSRNIVLGREPMKSLGPFRWFDRKKADQLAELALQKLGVHLDHDLNEPAASLSGGQRQSLAIARAVLFGSSCLILDEPTSALAVRQATNVLVHVRAAADAGQAVILITHNFSHALSVADDIVVLGRGRIASTFAKDEINLEQLTALVAKAS
jgi:simple sugar transport system ATP-binding protein